MIDLNLIRQSPEKVVENLKRRQDFDVNLIYEVRDLDKEWRSLKSRVDALRHEKNTESLKINQLKKEGKLIDEQVKKVREINKKLVELEKKANEIRSLLDEKLLLIPNLLADDVPVGEDDTENVVVRAYGNKPQFDFPVKDHIDIVLENDLAEWDTAAEIAGSRFYFLKNELVELHLALVNFVLKKLKDKGFDMFVTPDCAREKCFIGTGFLPYGRDDLYKIEGEDLYLVGTAEVVLAGRYMDKVIEKKDLPVKTCGVSHCFRTEAGSHGRDTKGIFRVHQFEKIEMFIFSLPEESYKLHEFMIGIAEEIFKDLGIHYRIVNICTGDLGPVAAKKYDLEAWLPGQGKYREMVSCSNCTDYQARRLNIKYQDDGKLKFVHTLNSTAVALPRALIAILENYQTEDSNVRIPDVLKPFIGRDLLLRK